MEDNTLKTRVKKFLEFSKISHTEFARMASVTAAYVTNIRNNITVPVLRVLKEINPQLNLDWLLLGVGEMLNTTTETYKTQIEALKAEHSKYVEYLKANNADLREKIALYQKIVKLESELQTGKK